MAVQVSLRDLFTNGSLGDTISVFAENTLAEVKQKIILSIQETSIEIFPQLLSIQVKDGITGGNVEINKPMSTVSAQGEITYQKRDENTMIMYSTFTKSGFVQDNILFIRNGYEHDLENVKLDNDRRQITTETAATPFQVLHTRLSKLYGQMTEFELSTILDFKYRRTEDISLDMILQDILTKGTSLVRSEAQLQETMAMVSSGGDSNRLVPQVLIPGTSINILPFQITGSVMAFKHRDLTVDLHLLFNLFQVTEEVPFLAMNQGNSEPVIKVFTAFKETTAGKALLKTWMFDSKGERLSMPKGLLIKVREGSNGSTGSGTGEGAAGYLSVNVYSTGTLSVRCSWAVAQNAGISELRQCVSRIVPLVKSINEFPIVFQVETGSAESSFTFPTFEKSHVISLDSILVIPFDLDVGSIAEGLTQSSVFQNVFEIKDTSKANSLVLQFIRLPDTSSFTVDEFKVTWIYNISVIIRNVKGKGLSVSCFGCKTFGQIQSIYKYVVGMIQTVIPGSGSAVTRPVRKELSQVARDRQPTKILNMLKSYGIPVNSRSCQGPRQPVVDDLSELTLLEGNYGPSYRMDYHVESTGQTHKLTCANVNAKHVYPGITTSGVPCCFLKPQKRYIPGGSGSGSGSGSTFGSELGSEVSGANETEKSRRKKIVRYKITNPTVIVTNKILDPGRIGVLPPKIQTFFETAKNVYRSRPPGPDVKYIYRFGIPESENSFLECILFYITTNFQTTATTATVSHLKTKLIDFLVNSDVYRTLQVSDSIGFNDYVDLIGQFSANIPIELITELVSEYLKVHIYIFSEEPEGVVCTNIGEESTYNKSLLLFYHSEQKNRVTNYGHYEPIVFYNSDSTGTATTSTSTVVVSEFTRTQFETVLDFIKLMYDFSCKATPPKNARERLQPTVNTLVNPKKSKRGKGGNKLEPMYQVVNAFSEVLFLVSAIGSGGSGGRSGVPVLIPVKPTKMITTLKPLSPKNAFKMFKRDAETTIRELLKLDGTLGLVPKYQILDNSVVGIAIKETTRGSPRSKVTAIVTDSGLIVPVVSSPRIVGLDTIRMHYIPDLDEVLASQPTYRDTRSRIIHSYNVKMFTINQARIELARHLTSIEPNLKKEMIKVLENRKTDKYIKKMYIQEKIQEILGQVIGSPRQNKRGGGGDSADLQIEVELPTKRLATSDITVAAECTQNPAMSWYTDFGEDSVTNGQCRFSMPDQDRFSDTVQIISNEIMTDPDHNLLNGRINTEEVQSGVKFYTRPNEVLLFSYEEAVEFIQNL